MIWNERTTLKYIELIVYLCYYRSRYNRNTAGNPQYSTRFEWTEHRYTVPGL